MHLTKQDIAKALGTGLFALLLSYGIGISYAAWTSPTQVPPSGNVMTPINTGTIFQFKEGGLAVNTGGAEGTVGLQVWGGLWLATTTTTFHNSLRLQVDGNVGARKYCDENGLNCIAASSLGSGSGSGSGNPMLNGNGSDGIIDVVGGAVISGMTRSGNIFTLTRDIFATDLTIGNGKIVDTNGYRIFVKGTLTNNGTISRDGNNGSKGDDYVYGRITSGGAGGAGLSAGTVAGAVGGSAGGRGGAGAGPGSYGPDMGIGGLNVSEGLGNNGVLGGVGGSGGTCYRSPGEGGAAGGVAGLLKGTIIQYPIDASSAYHLGNTYPGPGCQTVGSWSGEIGDNVCTNSVPGSQCISVNFDVTGTAGRTPTDCSNKIPVSVSSISVRCCRVNSSFNASAGSGGGGGGGKGFDYWNGWNSHIGGGGGGAGGNGGMIVIFAQTLINNGTISANGGNGGAGGKGQDAKTGDTNSRAGGGGGGGGSGGQGGVVLLVYGSKTGDGIIETKGGKGAAGGAGGAANGLVNLQGGYTEYPTPGSKGGDGNTGNTGKIIEIPN
jgi:hypothetical protein